MFKSKNIGYHILGILILIVGYQEVFLFQHSLCHDAVNCYLQWRIAITESIQLGVLPLWEPYQELGSPIWGNPQIGVWYPVLWGISLFGKYDYGMLNLEYFIHFIIAYFGFFKLSYHFTKNIKIAIFGALLYVFSGYFIGNFQHLSWVISGAWLPWFIYLLQKSFSTKGYYYPALFSITSFLFFTSCYPTYIITLFYITSVYILVIYFKNRNRETLKKSLFILISILGLLAITLYSVYYVIPLITRGNGLTLNQASRNTFDVNNWISFISSYVSTQKQQYGNTDISMANGYVGIISLTIFFYVLLYKRKKRNITFLVLTFLFLGVAAGKSLFIFPLLHDYLPGFKLFKELGLFRIFSIVSIILLVISNIQDFSQDKKSTIIITSSLSIASIITLYLYFRFIVDFPKVDTLGCILRQGKIQILILVGIILLTFIKKYNLQLIIVLSVSEIIISQRLNFPFTVHSNNNLQVMDETFEQIASKTQSYTIKDQRFTNKIHKNKQIIELEPMTMGIMKHEFTYIGGTSFQLKNWNTFIKNIDTNQLINKPIISTIPKNKKIFISSFNKNKFTLKLNSKLIKKVILKQTYVPGWKLIINHKEHPISLENKPFMTAIIPNNTKKIEFIYKPKYIYFFLTISILTFCFLFTFILMSYFKKQSISN
jgi:hypothetical protein